MLENNRQPAVNNQFYEDLGERWYNDDEHIIALLRAESRLKIVYVQQVLKSEDIPKGSRILDVGCGAGFLSNRLAADHFEVFGLDQSASSVAVAQKHVPLGAKVHYSAGDAYALDFPDASFDAVLLMDFLEHVDEPDRVIQEASRVLRPGGTMIFYTFNRTVLAKFVAIDAVSLIARDCPKHFHVWHLFIKPTELASMISKVGMKVREYKGLRPIFSKWPFWSSLFNRRVHKEFDFKFTSSLALGYLGYAVKSL